MVPSSGTYTLEISTKTVGSSGNFGNTIPDVGLSDQNAYANRV